LTPPSYGIVSSSHLDTSPLAAYRLENRAASKQQKTARQ
jgi:hypothetical protein